MNNKNKPGTKQWYIDEIFKYMEIIDSFDDFEYFKSRLLLLTDKFSDDVRYKVFRRLRYSRLYSISRLCDFRALYVRLLRFYFSSVYEKEPVFTLPLRRIPLFEISNIYGFLRDYVMHM